MSVALQIAVVVGYLLPLVVVGSLARGAVLLPCRVRARHSRTGR